MIARRLGPKLRALARRFPVVTVTGPRQAGKTTLCKALFPRHRYVSLETPDTREYATDDPRGFLAELGRGAVIDEVQRAPALLSYLQEEVDARPRPGRFVLTGSANLGLLAGVSQTLAGRTGLLTLLPFGHDELNGFEHAPRDRDATIWSGAFPAVFDRRIAPPEWFPAYLATYVERDVRQILNVTDLHAFQSFVRLCAGRVGQLVNLASLGADCGVTHNTARAWLSVLEASYVVLRVPPWHANLGKRLIKTPKLYFVDSGLLCSLLGIRKAAQLAEHPLRGAVFENWVMTEILKSRVHRGLPADLHFFRSREGIEVDAVIESGPALLAAEIKAGRTIASDFFASLDELRRLLGASGAWRGVRARLVYGGDAAQKRKGVEVVPWSQVANVAW
ncbi:MAG TPA: ATP-binding protein [Vicinamibacteria bacterium]|nr:ATP-binding protein [Vicinamibacteria bacterium]